MGIFDRFEHSCLGIEVPQAIIHKADEPDVVVHFLDAEGLAGENLAEVDPQADAPAAGNHDGFIVERIVDGRAIRCRDAEKVDKPRQDISYPELYGDAGC